MKSEIIFLLLAMVLSGRALPVNDKEILSSSCIEMTPDREQEIHKIVEEVNGFIETLSDKHEDIDFTLVKLKIEKHSDDEHDDKETVLKIVINDCKNADTKTRNAKYLEKNFVADDNSKLEEETNSDEKIEYNDTKSDFERNSESLEEIGRNLKVKEKRSKINEYANIVNYNKQTQSKPSEESEESSRGKNYQHRNESKDKTTRQTLHDDEIETLIKNLEDLNDKQLLTDSDNGVYIFAPTIDNSKVELNNHNDELFKDLYKSAIQKLSSLETELEKIKQDKTNSGLTNFKDLFDRNAISNPYYGFGRNVFDNYVNGMRSNSAYGNTGLEVMYF